MIEFRAAKEIWTDSVSLYAREQLKGDTSFLVADGIKRVRLAPGELAPKFIELPIMEGYAQSLFDALWEVGFRPHNGESSVAHVNAINDHLQDMRKLVFKDEK